MVWHHFSDEMDTAYPQPQVQYPLDFSMGFLKLRQEQTGQLNGFASVQYHLTICRGLDLTQPPYLR